MVFFLPQDKEDFITCSKGQRRFKVVSDVDGRTIRIQFRKGTKAERMFNLADMWNAEIMWGKLSHRGWNPPHQTKVKQSNLYTL